MTGDVDPLRRFPVVVGRSTVMPGLAALSKLHRDVRAAVAAYLTEVAHEAPETAARAAELVDRDHVRTGTTVVALTGDQLAAYASLGAAQVDR